ncbi:MAG: hypothetical protein AAFP92_33065, partial [Bacteroidota bacterium]
VNEKGDLALKLTFSDEAPGTYRQYSYTWISEDEYSLKSVQYDASGKKTGLFYAGNFVRMNQAEKNKAYWQQKLDAIHKNFIAAAKEKKPGKILSYYADSTLFIPEFHPLILGKANVKSYYAGLFARQEMKSYERKTQNLLQFEDRLAEWGTFTQAFTQDKKGPFRLTGKYLQIWEILPNDELRLSAQQWNYDHEIPEGLDLKVGVAGMPLRYKTQAAHEIRPGLKYEMDAYYALGAKAVKTRNAYGRLHSYAQDGVFLAPHGQGAKIGYEAIRDYLIDYNAGEVQIDSIEVGLNHVEEYGQYLIKLSYYYVEASGDGWTYAGQGLGINLMRRHAQGQLQRLWQGSSEFAVPPAPVPEQVVAFAEARQKSLLSGNAVVRKGFYAADAYLLGEYQPVLKGAEAIGRYHAAFLDRFAVSQFESERLELLDLGGWLLETGTFDMTVSAKNATASESLPGKYQTLWRQAENGQWEVFAEAWNYSRPVEDWGRFHFPEIAPYDHLASPWPKVPLQVQALNQLSEEIISGHDAERWTELYDTQGMLLYSHSPLYQGKSAVGAHLQEHVKGLPTFRRLDIGTFFLIELKDYIVELGNHYVDWAFEDQQGISTGKNIRTWKKGKDGRLRVYRQVAMYDVRE